MLALKAISCIKYNILQVFGKSKSSTVFALFIPRPSLFLDAKLSSKIFCRSSVQYTITCKCFK
jgi:hypothetical protein